MAECFKFAATGVRHFAPIIFLLEMVLDVQIMNTNKNPDCSNPRLQLDAPNCDQVQSVFSACFAEEVADAVASRAAGRAVDVNGLCTDICSSMNSAASIALPTLQVRPHKPWIGPATQDIISRRDLSRRAGNRELEKDLNKDIRLACDGTGQIGSTIKLAPQVGLKYAT